ncbi:hypothetical protein ACH5RR_014113 [Cinchona calisaya]|uniref:TF-B3 domain-containing protein n=1 Tax=Cinchona calisaya TaxID=153742 RepID=A0ABD3A1Y1_9GENT
MANLVHGLHCLALVQRIPPSFVKQHEEKVTKEWILRTPPLKKMWAVQVDENGGHYHLRGQAWQKFAKISNLMYGDSLLFLYVGKTRDQDCLSVFDVVLIDGSGLPRSPCQLVLDSITSSLDVVEKDGIINHVTPSTETARPLRTRFVQEGSSDKRVGRSKDSRNSKRSKATAAFVREAKLDKKKIIYLISPKSGKKWKMELCTGANGRISMGRGWSCFRDENRRIPTAFVRDYGESLEKVVLLKVPTGASWPIELLQNDVGTWLQKGWREFAEYYSIQECHFLVFKYDGNSQFHVIIFDQSASEIEYPVETTDHNRSDPSENSLTGHHKSDLSENSSDNCTHHDNDDDQLTMRGRSRARKLDEIESDDDSVEILDIPAASYHTNHGKKSTQADERASVVDSSLRHRLRPRRNIKISRMTKTTDSRGRHLITRGSPHFFKVVFSPIDQGIKIPAKFMRKYGDNLKEMVWLKVPTGVAWPVELLHTDNGTWLHKGWQEFAEYYSIEKFQFLVFRYDENSHFHVLIFDNTASEIDYPIESTPHRVVICDGEDLPRKISRVREVDEIYSDDDGDESVEILEEISAPCKGEKWGRNLKNAHQVDKDNNGYFHGLQLGHRIKEESYNGTGKSTAQFSMARDRTTLRKGTSFAYRRAKAYKSKYPFFIVFMQPSYVSGSFTVNIPLAFARDYLITSMNCYLDLDLCLSEGKKKWPVRCNFNSRNGKIYRGWKEFVLENSLVVGDVCIFELVGEPKIFNVTIYRRSS